MSFKLSCSFASYSDAKCDTLSSCEKDVKSHLRQLKVPQTSVRSEKELILAREGLFYLNLNIFCDRKVAQ